MLEKECGASRQGRRFVYTDRRLHLVFRKGAGRWISNSARSSTPEVPRAERVGDYPGESSARNMDDLFGRVQVIGLLASLVEM
jgi:hypothetical protein